MALAVIAIGGNALSPAHQGGTAAQQFANAKETCQSIIQLITQGWKVVLTHGNGPQVGNVLLRSELAASEVPPDTLDLCDASTEGTIGYMLQQVLGNSLRFHKLSQQVVTLVTQILVDPQDRAFQNPDKPIGPYFKEDQAKQKESQLGWKMKYQAPHGFRRVVPSPKPLKIIEIDAIAQCVHGGLLPIACGGGGIPVVENNGELSGVEAVIDKDRASALLARELRADLFLISTGVAEVQLRFGTPDAVSLSRVGRAEMRQYYAAGEFPAGSMGPKIEAALDFLDHGGTTVIITDPPHMVSAVKGQAGTTIR